MSAAVLDRLDAVVDELAALEWDALTDDEVLDVARWVETVRRRLAPVDHAVIGQFEQRSLPFTHGCRTTTVLLSNLVRITRAEAAARVHAAEALGRRRTVTGELVEPRFPLVAAAQTEGAISDRHAAVIVQAVDRLPDAIADEFGEFVEKTLTEQARDMDARQLYGHAGALTYALDQDGQLKDTEYRERQRRLDLRERADGSARLEADLTAEATAYLRTVLEPITKRTGTTDIRTATQRRHDGFLESLKLILRAELVPNAGGITTSVVLTMDADAWVTGTGVARTGHGYTIPASVAKRWAGSDCKLILTLLSRTKSVVAYSSTHRIFTEQQRLALMARDKGSTFPDCDVPANRCEVHHVREFQDGGATSTDNGAFACCFDHRHHEAMGWRCVMLDGRPAWIPPKWLDPEQRPRRNTRHD